MSFSSYNVNVAFMPPVSMQIDNSNQKPNLEFYSNEFDFLPNDICIRGQKNFYFKKAVLDKKIVEIVKKEITVKIISDIKNLEKILDDIKKIKANVAEYMRIRPANVRKLPKHFKNFLKKEQKIINARDIINQMTYISSCFDEINYVTGSDIIEQNGIVKEKVDFSSSWPLMQIKYDKALKDLAIAEKQIDKFRVVYGRTRSFMIYSNYFQQKLIKIYLKIASTPRIVSENDALISQIKEDPVKALQKLDQPFSYLKKAIELLSSSENLQTNSKIITEVMQKIKKAVKRMQDRVDVQLKQAPGGEILKNVVLEKTKSDMKFLFDLLNKLKSVFTVEHKKECFLQLKTIKELIDIVNNHNRSVSHMLAYVVAHPFVTSIFVAPMLIYPFFRLVNIIGDCCVEKFQFTPKVMADMKRLISKEYNIIISQISEEELLCFASEYKWRLETMKKIEIDKLQKKQGTFSYGNFYKYKIEFKKYLLSSFNPKFRQFKEMKNDYRSNIINNLYKFLVIVSHAIPEKNLIAQQIRITNKEVIINLKKFKQILENSKLDKCVNNYTYYKVEYRNFIVNIFDNIKKIKLKYIYKNMCQAQRIDSLFFLQEFYRLNNNQLKINMQYLKNVSKSDKKFAKLFFNYFDYLMQNVLKLIFGYNKDYEKNVFKTFLDINYRYMVLSRDEMIKFKEKNFLYFAAKQKDVCAIRGLYSKKKLVEKCVSMQENFYVGLRNLCYNYNKTFKFFEKDFIIALDKQYSKLVKCIIRYNEGIKKEVSIVFEDLFNMLAERPIEEGFFKKSIVITNHELQIDIGQFQLFVDSGKFDHELQIIGEFTKHCQKYLKKVFSGKKRVSNLDYTFNKNMLVVKAHKYDKKNQLIRALIVFKDTIYNNVMQYGNENSTFVVFMRKQQLLLKEQRQQIQKQKRIKNILVLLNAIPDIIKYGRFVCSELDDNVNANICWFKVNKRSSKVNGLQRTLSNWLLDIISIIEVGIRPEINHKNILKFVIGKEQINDDLFTKKISNEIDMLKKYKSRLVKIVKMQDFLNAVINNICNKKQKNIFYYCYHGVENKQYMENGPYHYKLLKKYKTEISKDVKNAIRSYIAGLDISIRYDDLSLQISFTKIKLKIKQSLQNLPKKKKKYGQNSAKKTKDERMQTVAKNQNTNFFTKKIIRTKNEVHEEPVVKISDLTPKHIEYPWVIKERSFSQKVFNYFQRGGKLHASPNVYIFLNEPIVVTYKDTEKLEKVKRLIVKMEQLLRTKNKEKAYHKYAKGYLLANIFHWLERLSSELRFPIVFQLVTGVPFRKNEFESKRFKHWHEAIFYTSKSIDKEARFCIAFKNVIIRLIEINSHDKLTYQSFANGCKKISYPQNELKYNFHTHIEKIFTNLINEINLIKNIIGNNDKWKKLLKEISNEIRYYCRCAKTEYTKTQFSNVKWVKNVTKAILNHVFNKYESINMTALSCMQAMLVEKSDLSIRNILLAEVDKYDNNMLATATKEIKIKQHLNILLKQLNLIRVDIDGFKNLKKYRNTAVEYAVRGIIGMIGAVISDAGHKYRIDAKRNEWLVMKMSSEIRHLKLQQKIKIDDLMFIAKKCCFSNYFAKLSKNDHQNEVNCKVSMLFDTINRQNWLNDKHVDGNDSEDENIKSLNGKK